MQAGQVSVWVPIIVGIIGLIGIIAAQLVNAWREDRREKLRAHLELERDQLKYRHEKSLWWIEQRASVYEQILTRMSECQTDIEQVRADNEDGIKMDSPAYSKIESQVDDLIRPFIQRTTLIAPPEVQTQIKVTLEQLISLLGCVLKETLARSLFDYDDECLKLNEASDKMHELMQADLGITHPR